MATSLLQLILLLLLVITLLLLVITLSLVLTQVLVILTLILVLLVTSVVLVTPGTVVPCTNGTSVTCSKSTTHTCSNSYTGTTCTSYTCTSSTCDPVLHVPSTLVQVTCTLVHTVPGVHLVHCVPVTLVLYLAVQQCIALLRSAPRHLCYCYAVAPAATLQRCP